MIDLIKCVLHFVPYEQRIYHIFQHSWDIYQKAEVITVFQILSSHITLPLSLLFFRSQHFWRPCHQMIPLCLITDIDGSWSCSLGSYSGAHTQRGPTLGLILCYCLLESLHNSVSEFVFYKWSPMGQIKNAHRDMCSMCVHHSLLMPNLYCIHDAPWTLNSCGLMTCWSSGRLNMDTRWVLCLWE